MFHVKNRDKTSRKNKIKLRTRRGWWDSRCRYGIKYIFFIMKHREL